MNFRSRQWCRRAARRGDRNCPTPGRFDIAPALSAAELIYFFTVLVCVYDTIHIIANTGMILLENRLISSIKIVYLAYRYTCMRFFCSGFWHLSNTYRPNNEASEFFSILFLNSLTYSNFLTFIGDSVDAESHSASTESTPSETPHQLSQCGVRLHVN